MLARDHHYLFSHVHLRNQALRSPEKMLEELQKPMREGFLMFLWKQVEEVANESVSAAGLNVAGVDQIGGGTLALIQLPTPERATESFFAAIWNGPAGPRFFVFDRSAAEEGQGVLAELELDDTRINMGNHPATQQALLEALGKELTGRVPSVRPTPPTVAMGSIPPVAPGAPLVPSPAPVGAPAPMHTPPPGPATKPSNKKRNLIILGVMALAAPLMCCLGTCVMAYDSGIDDDATFTVEHELTTDDQDHERLVLTFEGPEEIWSYDLSGPGSDQCTYISSYNSRCEITLDAIADATPSYTMTAHAHGPRFFGERLGDPVVLTETVEVTRTLGLRYSEAARTTVVSGFPGRLEITRDGQLRLTGAPTGTALMVGPNTASGPSPTLPLDIAAITNAVGVTAVLRGGQRFAVPNVNVRLADGTTAGGTAQFQSGDLMPALLDRLARLGEADLGEATGSAVVWIGDGQLRDVAGEPHALADVGSVILTESREVSAGRCGPYSLYGIGYGSRIPRRRWQHTVRVYDRVNGRRVARRRFRNDRPSCPYSISQGTRSLSGTRDMTEADAYAREHLAPPTEE